MVVGGCQDPAVCACQGADGVEGSLDGRGNMGPPADGVAVLQAGERDVPALGGDVPQGQRSADSRCDVPPHPPSRPRFHGFPTFEHRVPLELCPRSPIVLREGAVAKVSPTDGPMLKPDLTCMLCKGGIRSFGGLVVYLLQIIGHSKVDCADRLEEVWRGAGLD